MTQDRTIVTIKCEWETLLRLRLLSFRINLSDLEWLSEIFSDSLFSHPLLIKNKRGDPADVNMYRGSLCLYLASFRSYILQRWLY